ncbi:MAG: hypothetical protein ACI97A_003285 [Planctomycetota bacterium]|jgi:hypothetical protein
MDDMSTGLIFAVFYGAVGFGYFIYGRKQQHLIALLCGMGLLVLPYFTANIYALILLGIALMAGPFLRRH